jgi:hypothetical protein
LAASPRQDFQDVDYSFAYPRSWYEAIIARARGDNEKAKMAFATASAVLEERFKVSPNVRTRAVLAEVHAGLGLNDLARSEISMATERMPLSRDAYNGALVLQSRAQVAVWTGDNLSAIETLKILLSRPGYVSYGILLLDPAWAPLRSDPQFQALLQSQEPIRPFSQSSDPKASSRRSAPNYVADPPRNSPRIEREPGVANNVERAVPQLDVVVSDSAGKAAYKGVTDSKGTFGTPPLNPGKYIVQFTSKRSIDVNSKSLTLVVSAGKTKVTAESVAAQKLSGRGVAMKIDVGMDTNVSGQVANSMTTKGKKEERNLVWIRPKLGSNLPGHWAPADSPEAKEAMTQGTFSRQSLQDRQSQGVGAPIAPPAIPFRQ